MFKVSFLISTKYGSAPQSFIEFTVAMKVKDGKNIISPFLIDSANKEACRAVEPDDVSVTYLALVILEI